MRYRAHRTQWSARVRRLLWHLIRHQATGQPHHFNIPPGFTFQATARLNSVEVTVNMKLQHNRRMKTLPARRQWINPAKTQITQIKFIDKDINKANRIVPANEIIQSFGEDGALLLSYAPRFWMADI